MERLTLVIENWQKTALEKMSETKGISTSELLREVLTAYLKDEKPKHLRSLTETPDSELDEYDRAIKAWCEKELKQQAKWLLTEMNKEL